MARTHSVGVRGASSSYLRRAAPRHIAVAGLVVAVSTAIGTGDRSHVAEAATPSDRQVSDAADERATYGLPAGGELVRSIMSGGEDAGTATWGIVLTAAEDKALDLPGHMTFVVDFDRDVEPVLSDRAAFGGVWFDQRHDGRAVVMLTKESQSLEDRVRSRMPATSRGVKFELVEHTLDELTAAFERAPEAWRRLDSKLAPQGFGIGVSSNSLRMKVDIGTKEAFEDDAASLSKALGVPVDVLEEPIGSDVHCPPQRDHCGPNEPFRSGPRIWERNDNGTTYSCTMGFHIIVPASATPYQFLTSGHCGYDNANIRPPSDNWYARDHGKVGNEKGTLYADNGIDIMRISIDDGEGQASHRVMSTGIVNMDTAMWPYEGQPICASLGRTGAIDCGTVFDATASWKSDTPAAPDPADYDVTGASAESIFLMHGDSGSPVYARRYLSGSDSVWVVPIGVADREKYGGRAADMYFAKVKDGLNAWNATIYR